MIKKFIKLFFIFLIIAIIIFLIYEAMSLKIYIKNEDIIVSELSKEQKNEDFKYLTTIISEIYPFAELIENVKGLKNITSLKESFIERAGKTKNNEEFLLLFIEYLEYLRQAGHGGILFLNDYNFYTSYSFNIPKDAFLKSNYWLKLASQLNLYVHNDLNIIYFEGQYILNSPYIKNNQLIEKGSIVKSIDNINIDEYVKLLQNSQPLLYDSNLEKSFASQLFMVDLNQENTVWKVEFKKPNGEFQVFTIPKKQGYKLSNEKIQIQDNLLLKELNSDTAYLKIKSFGYEHIEKDGEKIQNFFKDSKGKYETLIIDLRGNIGGEIIYWAENLIKPFINEDKTLEVFTAVRKKFISRMNRHLLYYRLFTSNDLLDRKTNDITNVKKIKIEDLNPKDWNVYKITKLFKPKNTYDFNGKIFILVDKDTISAADSYISAAKELGLGTVMGDNTSGWGNQYIQPWIFSLPNSGLMFRMDVELAYNADKKESSIYGTSPDIYLQNSTYPTSCPEGYDLEDLIKEPWIKRILDNNFK